VAFTAPGILSRVRRLVVALAIPTDAVRNLFLSNPTFQLNLPLDAEECWEKRELSASLHDSGRSGLVTSVVMLDRARRTDYDPQDAVGCTGRDATNLPAI